MRTITFTVFGVARPAGSKRSLVPVDRRTGQPFRRRDGGIVVSTVDDNPKTKSWQAAVADAARRVYGGQLLDGPLSVSLHFMQPRPKGHFGARGLRASAPRYPISRPDVLKLARACEDALTGVIWRDDAQIVVERLYKDWGEPARVLVEIEQLADNRPRDPQPSVLFQD